jgi:hypothetical protein
VKTIPKSEKTKVEEIDPQEDLKQELKQINNKINKFKDEVAKNQNQMLQRIEETIKTQEEIIMDMIKKFNEEYYQHKTSVLAELEHLKNQQDVLKISYTVNENKLLDKIEKIVIKKVHEKIDGRENEILMKIWIEEFKDILTNFEKLKKMNPNEFKIRLKEITETIDLFKSKMEFE